MRTAVIVNRNAGRIGPVLDALIAPERRGRFVLHETRLLADLDDAALALAELSPETRPEVVVLAGGDGSYSAGVTALARAFGEDSLPAIALAPGGTAGTVARNWTKRESWSGAKEAARIVDRSVLADASTLATRSRRRPTLRIRRETAGARDRIGFIVGAGLVARFFEVYEDEGAGGTRTAARIVARIFAGSMSGGALARHVLEPVPCGIIVDGERASFEQASLVCMSVVRDLGLGMKLLYRAGESSDRIHVVATPLGPARLGPQMPLVLAGRPLLGPKVDALAREVSLRFPAGTGAYVVDGDLLREDAVTISAGPVLRVVT